MEENNKKEITLNDLAELINETKKALEVKIDTSAEELATMTQKHFLSLEENIRELKSDTEEIKANLNKKVDVFVHKDLEYRVEKLEKKVSLAVA